MLHIIYYIQQKQEGKEYICIHMPHKEEICKTKYGMMWYYIQYQLYAKLFTNLSIPTQVIALTQNLDTDKHYCFPLLKTKFRTSSFILVIRNYLTDNLLPNFGEHFHSLIKWNGIETEIDTSHLVLLITEWKTITLSGGILLKQKPTDDYF